MRLSRLAVVSTGVWVSWLVALSLGAAEGGRSPNSPSSTPESTINQRTASTAKAARLAEFRFKANRSLESDDTNAALTQFEVALGLAIEPPPAKPDQVARLFNDYAALQIRLRRFESITNWGDRVAGVLRGTDDAKAARLAMASRLAIGWWFSSNTNAAEHILVQAVEEATSDENLPTPTKTKAHGDLAAFYLRTGRPKMAAEQYRAARILLATWAGETHAETVEARLLEAQSHYAAGDRFNAGLEASGAVSDAARSESATNLVSLSVQALLMCAQVDLDTGNFAGAGKALDVAASLADRHLSPMAAENANLNEQRARFHWGIKDYPLAEAFLQKTWHLKTNGVASERHDIASLRFLLARIRLAQARVGEAEQLITNQPSLQHISGTQYHLWHQTISNRLISAVLAKRHQMGPAIEAARRALLSQQQRAPEDQLMAADLRVDLACLLAQTGKNEEATKDLKLALKAFDADLVGKGHPQRVRAASLLVLLSDTREKDDDLRDALGTLVSAQQILLDSVLGVTSERQRLAWQEESRDFLNVLASIGDVYSLGSALTVTKGIILANTINEQHNTNSVAVVKSAENILRNFRLRLRLAQAVGDLDPRISDAIRRCEEVLEMSQVMQASEARRNPAWEEWALASTRNPMKYIPAPTNGYLWSSDRVVESVRWSPMALDARLPTNVFYLDFLKYDQMTNWNQGTPAYGVLVVWRMAAPTFLPRRVWVPLGAADGIERLTGEFRQLMRSRAKPEQRVQGVLQELHDRIWSPIRAAIEQAHRTESWILPQQSKLVFDANGQPRLGPPRSAFDTNHLSFIVCPDAELHFLPLAVLLDEQGTFLGEHHRFTYVSSGRDLFREPAATSAANGMVLVGAPDFDAPCLTPDSMADGGRALLERLLGPSISNYLATNPAGPATIAPPDFRALATNSMSLRSTNGTLQQAYAGVTLKPLPGTAREVDVLALLASRHGLQTEVLTGTNATEARVRELKPPLVLHLATHGLLVSDSASSLPSGGSRGGDFDEPEVAVEASAAATLRLTGLEPMHRSLVALASANPTLASWREGLVPDTLNDGLLTAEELSMLDLRGTWLVVLSACDTGEGKAVAGEGLFGLKRALLNAGAQNTLLSLWPIDDNETVSFMTHFYEHALPSRDAAGAMAATQQRLLRACREERGVFDAARFVGPFVLNMQGSK